MTPSPTAGLLQAARDLGPLLRRHAAEGDRQRELPREVVDALRSAGIFRMWVPRSLGGAELDYPAGLEVLEELARHDGAAAWVVFVAATGAPLLSRLSDEAAEQVLGDPSAIVCGSLHPPGRATPVPGGHRLQGRWSYVSGCGHASWLALSALVEGGAAGPHLFVVPAGQAQVVDTWHTGGLRGTGSHDVTVADVFVPTGWHFAMAPGATRSRHHQGALYRLPAYGFLGTPVAAVALGLARTALDALVEMATAKVPVGRTGTLREQQTTQVAVARAQAQVASARAWLFQLASQLWDEVQHGRPVPADSAAQLMLASSHAAWSAAAAVDQVQKTAGASAVYSANPIERAFRDIHAVTQHRRVAEVSFETVGRTLLGLEAGDPVLKL